MDKKTRRTKEDVLQDLFAVVGMDFVWWVYEQAIERDTHVMWWSMETQGAIQPVYWDLPGDRNYASPDAEVSGLRVSHH